MRNSSDTAQPADAHQRLPSHIQKVKAAAESDERIAIEQAEIEAGRSGFMSMRTETSTPLKR